MPAAAVDAKAEDLAAAFGRHAPAIARFLRGVGVRPADLQDLVQQVFLTAHEKGGYRPGAASERTWFLRLAWYAHVAYRRQRRHAPVTGAGAHADVEPWAEATQPRTVEARQRLAAVEQALSTMSEEHRATLMMFDVYGCTTQEIADTLEVPAGTVHSRLHVARKKLAAALGAAQENDR